MGLFGKKQSASEIAQKRGESLYQEMRGTITSYSSNSGLPANAKQAVREFLVATDADLSWVFDPSFTIAFGNNLSPAFNARFKKAESAVSDRLGSIERGARNAILIQDPNQVRLTAIDMLAEGLVEWFDLEMGSGPRASTDWVVASACADRIVEANGPNYVIAGHVQGIAFGVLAFWAESGKRAQLSS